jgi:hypothetical protein
MWADSQQYLFATDLHSGLTRDNPNAASPRSQIFLLTGGGFALVLGRGAQPLQAAVPIPAVPLLVAGGSVALRDLVVAVRRQHAPGR